ncbi:MAG TPA: DUF2339 domain-containing protein [Thermohalobaculum sp.]|nr:DUF2339 domain-containing protein [Thermohalobaculum sp.]
MEAILGLLGTAVGLAVILAVIFAWVAIFKISALSKRVTAVEAEVVAAHAAFTRMGQELWRDPETEIKPEPESPAEPEQPEDLPAVAAARVPAVEKSAEVPPTAAAPPAMDAAAGEAAAPPITPLPIPPSPGPARRGLIKAIEQELTSRWLVWLGAGTVALSAVFLVSYAVEQGLLGPLPRVVLGLLMGMALIAGGEWTHRRPIARLAGAVNPDYVPQALTASGVFALYASIFAAHAIFGLIGISVAFVALGAVSFAGLILAVRQGWFVALLGLAGGYAMPALLESNAPAAVPVFVYLFMLTAGCLAVMRFRNWPFLAIATLIGCAGWPMLWLFGPWTIGDQGTLSLYALATAAAFALSSTGFPVKRPDTPASAWLAAMFKETSGMGFVAHGLILVLLAMACAHNTAAFVFLGLYAGIGMAFGLRRAAFESLAVAAAIIVGLAFFVWPQPPEFTIPAELARHGIQNYGDTFGPIQMPVEFLIFARAALLFGAFYGITGFLALKRVATPPVWAALSAAMPLYLLTLAYWRIGGFDLNLQWGAMFAGLALLQLAAASKVDRQVGREQLAVPLSFYAAATTAALALAFTCVLREAWLTVALSIEVLALGWIWANLQVRAIRTIAYAAAALVIVRLVLNPEILDYHGSVAGLFSWVIYGYGIPAAAFLGASRLFGDARSDPLAALCEAAAVGFGFLMVALQLRVWTSGTIVGADYGLFDQAVQSVWWLIAAGLLLQRQVTARSKVALFGGRALLALAAVQIVLGHLLASNPLFVDDPVGEWPLVNLLGLAYLVPAVLCWWLAGERIDLPERVQQGSRIVVGVLIFVYLTLEVRHLFQGSLISLSYYRVPENGEIYTYSAVWTVYSLVLLAVGILQGSSMMRHASLAVLIVAVVKVFLYDTSDLTGLFRVASFLGLGLTLIGIGYIYRRFVSEPPPQEG